MVRSMIYLLLLFLTGCVTNNMNNGNPKICIQEDIVFSTIHILNDKLHGNNIKISPDQSEVSHKKLMILLKEQLQFQLVDSPLFKNEFERIEDIELHASDRSELGDVRRDFRKRITQRQSLGKQTMYAFIEKEIYKNKKGIVKEKYKGELSLEIKDKNGFIPLASTYDIESKKLDKLYELLVDDFGKSLNDKGIRFGEKLFLCPKHEPEDEPTNWFKTSCFHPNKLRGSCWPTYLASLAGLAGLICVLGGCDSNPNPNSNPFPENANVTGEIGQIEFVF